MSKLAIDLGGTTIKGALFHGGEIVREHAVPTRGSEGRAAIFSALCSLIDELKAVDSDFIGVSSAGNIDAATCVSVYASDNLLGWTGMRLKEELETRYGVPCRVDNDAVCALKGELRFYPRLRNVTMLTFGTGVGGASLQGGAFLRGTKFDAARWGHVCLNAEGRACNCGKRGCAEAYLSATALLKRGRELIPELASCKELFERYAAGDENARGVLKEFGVYLNALLDTVRTVLAPELILLGGGVAASEEIFLELIREKSDVAFARLGNRAGIYGALETQ